MLLAPIPAYEEERLQAVKSLNLLDTKSEVRFDHITEKAVKDLNAPISTITLVDKDREWYKSKQGIIESEGNRSDSFCGHTILGQNIFVVEDAKNDDRFKDNPKVIGGNKIRFYAGVALYDRKSKMPVGAFCVKDTKPRKMTVEEMNKVLQLAKEAENEINRPKE